MTGQSHRAVHRILTSFAAIAALGCSPSDDATRVPTYLFVWAGPHQADSAGHRAHRIEGAGGNDFLAVIDADPASPKYGSVIASKDVGVPGMMAHHTELTLPVNNALFTNDYLTGQIFLLDVADPRAPRLAGRIDSVPGFKTPHSFARLPNGNVIAAMQYSDGKRPGNPGGLAEFDPTGRLLRTSSAADSLFPGARIRTNGIELLPAIDRMVTTSMPMDMETTADVVQVWRMSDLHLLRTLAMPVVKGDSLHTMPYDARVLADGHTAMLNTYYCGLFRVSDLGSDHPRIDNVGAIRSAHSAGCAVAAIVDHYWIVPVADDHTVVSFDVADPGHPVEVSRLRMDSAFMPHWISTDPSSDRVVITGADGGEARVFIADVSRKNGRLSIDGRFRDPGSSRSGISFNERAWPHGFVGHAMAHGAVFGPAPSAKGNGSVH